MSVGMDRGQSRQDLIKALFEQFVEHERADRKAYHAFCNWAAGKSRLQIERELKDKNGRGFWA